MKGIRLRGMDHLASIIGKAVHSVKTIGLYNSTGIDVQYFFNITDNSNNNPAILHLTRGGGRGFDANPNNLISEIKKYYNINIDPKIENEINDLYFIKGFRISVIQPETTSRIRYGRLMPTEITFAITKEVENEYEEFVKANKKACETSFRKYYNKESNEALFAFIATDGNPTYFSWAMKMMAQHKITTYGLLHLMDFATEYSQSIRKLSKQNIVSLSSSKDVLDAIWESFHIRAEHIANKTLSLFNPAQKKLLKENLDNPAIVQTLNNFSKLSMVKKINFVRKVSTMDNLDEIVKLMKFICSNSHFNWNQQDFHEFIKNVEGLNYTIVLDKPNLTVLQVHDFETVKRLGKMTNWCISKNRSYWDQYMKKDREPHLGYYGNANDDEFDEVNKRRYNLGSDEKSKSFRNLINADEEKSRREGSGQIGQFMIFDFNRKEDDKLSIVGVTSNTQKGITHAHNFVNDNMVMRNGEHELVAAHPILDAPNVILQWLDIFEPDSEQEENIVQENKRLSSNKNIFGFLNNQKIDLSLFSKYDYKRFDWNRENLLNFINEYIDEDEYDIIYDEGDKMLISTTSLRFGSLTDKYNMLSNHVRSNFMESPKSFFCYFDFSRVSSPNKMLFYSIFENDYKEYSSEPINEFGNTLHRSEDGYYNFTDLLFELGLPFDTIKRPDTIEEKLEHFARVDNYDMVMSLLKEYFSKTENFNVTSTVKKSLTGFLCDAVEEPNSLLKLYNSLKSLNIPFDKLLSNKGVQNIIKKIITFIINFSYTRGVDSFEIIDNLDLALDMFKKEVEQGRYNVNDDSRNVLFCSTDGRMYLSFLFDFMNTYMKDVTTGINVYDYFINHMISSLLNSIYNGRFARFNESIQSKTYFLDIANHIGDKWEHINNQAVINLLKLYVLDNKIEPLVYKGIDIFYNTPVNAETVMSIIVNAFKSGIKPEIFEYIITKAEEKNIAFTENNLHRISELRKEIVAKHASVVNAR